MNTKGTNIKKYILLPVILVIVILLIALVVGVNRLQHNNIQKRHAASLRETEEFFQMELDEDTQLIDSLIGFLESGTLLCITGDHGCDPTFRGTDHTREFVPLLWYSESRQPVNLGERGQFCDVAQTISVSFGAGKMKNGEVLFAP